MSAEFFILFQDINWYKNNQSQIKIYVKSLKTFKKEVSPNEYWLLGLEDRENKNRWGFDIRLFFKDDQIFFDVSAHPPTIEKQFSDFIVWLKQSTSIKIVDEDYVESNWGAC